MLGVVNLDKPVGPTSHDMVGLLRRLTGIRRIGHAGTLDPLASGVLPILVGAATRFSEELTSGRKRYDAVIRLGASSATDDAQGPITATEAPPPAHDAVRDALRGFVGSFEQCPPTFNARKVGGRTAHRAARAGTPVEVASRLVTVDGIEVTGFDESEEGLDVRIDIRCGAGTYIRSIARDLGAALGCGGYLRSLRRTEAAGLRAEDAVTPAELERLAAAGRLADAIRPVGDLIPLPRVLLEADGARRFAHGLSEPATEAPAGRVAVYGDGGLLGIGVVDGGVLRPEKVLPAEVLA